MDEATIVPTPGGGDCLFAAVAMAVPGTSKEGLRRTVASRALDPADAEFAAVLKTWALLWTESVKEEAAKGAAAGVSYEFAHASALAKQADGVLTPQVRAEIFRAMINPSIYWGEEVAVTTLERALSVGIWIYRRTRGDAVLFRRATPGASRTNGDVLLLLDLAGQHYSLLRLRKKKKD